MHSKGDWILLDYLQFVDNLLVSLESDEPLHTVYRRLFTAVVGKLKRYAHCSHGLHLMANVIPGRSGDPAKIETDHIYVDPGSNTYLLHALRARHGDRSAASREDELPASVPLASKEPVQAAGWKALLDGLLSGLPNCSPLAQDRVRWDPLFTLLNSQRTKVAKLDPIECMSSKVLLIPLSGPNSTLPPWSGLGMVLLWNNDGTPAVETICKDRGERLKMAARTLSVFLSLVLKSHCGVQQDTYLPSFRPRGQRQVTVMFADIRDFTPTTEICRNFRLISELTEFIKRYTEEMSLVIQDNGGHVHALAGDGIMALFGEYDLDPRQAAARAIQAADKMCKRFEILKADFFGNAKVNRFFREENEPMDMRLGIGISFGPVIFDYFGLPGSRSYGPLGDHVNFAQRLESEASRFDPQLVDRPTRMRAPILVSRPAWLAAGRDIEKPPLTLSVKGKPYAYQCYECWPTRAPDTLK